MHLLFFLEYDPCKYVSYLISVRSENEKKFREVRELSLCQTRIDLIRLSILTLLRKLFIYCWRFHNVAKVRVPDFAQSCHVLADKDVMVTIKEFITEFYSKPYGIMGGRSCHTYMDPRHYCCHM